MAEDKKAELIDKYKKLLEDIITEEVLDNFANSLECDISGASDLQGKRTLVGDAIAAKINNTNDTELEEIDDKILGPMFSDARKKDADAVVTVSSPPPPPEPETPPQTPELETEIKPIKPKIFIGVGDTGKDTESLRADMLRCGLKVAPKNTPFTKLEMDEIYKKFPQFDGGKQVVGSSPALSFSSESNQFYVNVNFVNEAGKVLKNDVVLNTLQEDVDGIGVFNIANGTVTPSEFAKLSPEKKSFLAENGINLNKTYRVYEKDYAELYIKPPEPKEPKEPKPDNNRKIKLTAAQEKQVGEIMREHFDGAGILRRGDNKLDAQDIRIGLKSHQEDLAALKKAGIKVEEVLAGNIEYDLSLPTVSAKDKSASAKRKD